MNLIELQDAELATTNHLGKALKTISFTAASKRIEYLGLNQRKELTDLCPEIYNMSMKVIEEGQKVEKMSCVHGLEGLAWLKCPYHPEQSTDSIQSLSKYQWRFPDVKTPNPTISVEPQRTLTSKAAEGEQSWRHRPPDFRLYCRAMLFTQGITCIKRTRRPTGQNGSPERVGCVGQLRW